jgi:hypothetical protein
MSEFESFNDMTPIELPASGTGESVQSAGTDGSIDTFDSPTLTEEQVKQELEKINEKGDGKIEQATQTEKIGKQEDIKDEPKKADDKAGDKPSEEEVHAKPEVKRDGKVVKIKDGSETKEIGEDATIKVKVKGKNEFVSIAELKKNYSGQVAFDEKFKEVTAEKESAKKEIDAYLQEKQTLASHLSHIAEIMDNPEKNPYEALSYLVDMRGGNPVEFNKRVLQYMSEEVNRISEMDSVEQELYWTRKEAELLKNRSTAKAEQESRAKAEMERKTQLLQLRESQGVSEEQYVQSERELYDLGYKKEQITPETIVTYSAMKPHYDKAEGLCAKFEEDLSTDDMDALISRTAKTLRENPKINEEDAIIYSAKMIGLTVETYDSDIKELNEKLPDETVRSPKLKYGKGVDDPNHIESFDDFDY